jgi:hypothetical protein
MLLYVTHCYMYICYMANRGTLLAQGDPEALHDAPGMRPSIPSHPPYSKTLLSHTFAILYVCTSISNTSIPLLIPNRILKRINSIPQRIIQLQPLPLLSLFSL